MRTVGAATEGFAVALGRVRAAPVRPEFTVDEGPAPQRLAPHAVALNAELAAFDDDAVSGRFVLLHDPDGVDEWGGDFRAVVFVKSPIEDDLVSDPMMHEVGWSWVTEALASNGAAFEQLGGTVTCTSSQSFGSMDERPAEGYLEIRGSWTPAPSGADPVEEEMDRHVSAWLAILGLCAGLPPLPVDVADMDTLRRRIRNETR
jgi:hypothetical protein